MHTEHPPHLARVATLPCETLVSAKQAKNDKLVRKIIIIICSTRSTRMAKHVDASPRRVWAMTRNGGNGVNGRVSYVSQRLLSNHDLVNEFFLQQSELRVNIILLQFGPCVRLYHIVVERPMLPAMN